GSAARPAEHRSLVTPSGSGSTWRSAGPTTGWDGPILLRVHAHGRGAGALGDHRRQVRVLRVLLLVGGIDAVLDRAVDGGEGDLGLDASCPDPSGVLGHRRLVPSGRGAVVGAHVHVAVDDDRPDPGLGPGRRAVRPVRAAVDAVGRTDRIDLLRGPGTHQDMSSPRWVGCRGWQAPVGAGRGIPSDDRACLALPLGARPLQGTPGTTPVHERRSTWT